MFVKTSLRDWLARFADFIAKALLAVFFLLPLPYYFLRVGLSTLFPAVLNSLPQLAISAVSGAENSNKSASTRFGAGMINLRTKEVAGLPIICASAPNPRSYCLLLNSSIERNFYLSSSNHLLTPHRIKMNFGGFFEHWNNTSDTDRYNG